MRFVIAIHQYSPWLIWSMFLLGQVLHIVKKAGLTTLSPQNPAISTLKNFFAANGVAVGIRVVLCVGLYWTILDKPDYMTNLQLGFLIPLVSHPGGSVVLGWFFDSVLDAFTGLSQVLGKGAVPQAPSGQ